MPFPSITTTMPGHGGGDAGTAVKNGTAISGIARTLPTALVPMLGGRRRRVR